MVTGVTGTIGGKLSKVSEYMSANVTVQPGLTVNITPVALLSYSKLPDTYQPGTVPCMKNCDATRQAGGDNQSRITWTRYL